MNGTEVVVQAKAWVGKEFNAGEPAQCAQFVRKVFQQVGINLPVSERPSDWAVTKDLPQGPALANSLSGDEQGVFHGYNDLEPGDIVLFRNTYGMFAYGTITHVGIYVGNGEMVHRPTSSRPVEKALMGNWSGVFVEARRPKAYDQLAAERGHVAAKVFVHPNGASLVVSETLSPGTYPINGLEMVFKLGKKA